MTASSAPPSAETLLPYRAQRPTQATGLSPDLLAESARRLRVVALLYAFAFFVSNPLTAMLSPEERAQFLESAVRWAPSTISITAALLVSGMTWSQRVPVKTILAVGVIFEVVGSFGIATAQYLDPARYALDPPWGGLSWVAVWMLGFTVVVPSPPRRALLAALGAASSVPLVVGLVMATDSTVRIPAMRFFLLIVLPYLIVVLIAYVCAGVVHGLGTELTRAREMGSYRLVERLAHGGMGEVWRARHRLLARPAAIKLLRPELVGGSTPGRVSELHARFLREAQATASLRSPHTVELYDFGITDDGAMYYVMELLDGLDAAALVERFGPVPPERAVHILQQVCHSLGEAHAEGLVHRDVKPANVYLCREGREVDFVKVLDFGLVKSLGDERTVDPNLTNPTIATGDQHAGGTPAFMSPEQVLGDRALDARSDIYAVGCLAYWLVTGELVFTGRTVMETMLLHTNTKPVPPSQRTELEVPDAFDRVVLACLAKSPDERPPTTDDLAARLATIELREAWTPDRAREWWDVHHPRAQRKPFLNVG